MSGRTSLLLLLVVLAAMTIVVASRLRFGSNITNLMPTGPAGTLADVARRLTESELSRTLVLSIGAPDLEAAVAAAQELAQELRAHPEVAWVREGVDPEEMQALYELYFPRRHYFLSEDPTRLAERLDDAALRERARATRLELASPAAPLLKRAFAADPLGGFRAVLQRFHGQQPALRQQYASASSARSEAEPSDDRTSPQFVSHDGRFAILFLGTRASAFDGKRQSAFLTDLAQRFAGVSARHGGDLVLEKSGASVFAVEAERSIRRDVNVLTIFGVVSVFLLFQMFFRSARSLLLSALPMLAGIVVATGAGMLVFGGLDGLTLGFGAAMIGVVIDYPTHLLSHLSFSPHRDDVAGTLARVRPSIALGGLTTIAGFAGLGLTAFPGFREIGFFAAVGVGVSLLVTLYVIPPLVRPAARIPALSRVLGDWLGRLVLRSARHRGRLALTALGLCAVSLAFLPRLRWVDDLSQLWRMDPALRAEDERVRARVSQFEAGRFVVALAPDRESALSRNEAVYARLAPLVARGEIGGVRSLHAFLWSRETQEANRAALLADPDLPARVERAFTAEGFRPGAFAGFARSLAEPEAPPLAIEDLLASPLADLVRPLVVELGSDAAVITYLQRVNRVEAVEEAVRELPGVHYVDGPKFLNDIYAAFRVTTVQQIFVGNALVIALLLVRYRRLRPALAAYFPSVVVALLLLGAFAALGVETNLFHAMSLVMVTGMGVDYGVFVVDSARDPDEMGTTMVSILLGSLTTVATFGALALSQHPALRAFGVTIGAGIFLAFLLAPLALALVDVSPSRRP